MKFALPFRVNLTKYEFSDNFLKNHPYKQKNKNIFKKKCQKILKILKKTRIQYF